MTYPRGGAAEGTQSSAGSVANGLVPTGKQGSELPILEPVKSGTAQPAAGPVNARHTVDSAAADTDPPGYSPAQIRQYLGLTGDGKGQTIAIVDAYDEPDIAADAETFSQQYGLPGVCGAGGAGGDCFHLNVEEQSATAGSNGNWALEESMDVEWAHSVAPDATIDVEEAASGDFAALFAGVATATAKHPAAVSMSWGIGEEFSEETYYDHFCRVSETVCVVSSGDLGYPGSYPAYNPSVLSVGGTTLTLGSGGSVTSELDWSQSGGGQAGSSGSRPTRTARSRADSGTFPTSPTTPTPTPALPSTTASRTSARAAGGWSAAPASAPRRGRPSWPTPTSSGRARARRRSPRRMTLFSGTSTRCRRR